MLTIVLIDVQIPQNAGNIARLCAGGKMRLQLVGDLGFRLSDKNFKRAGLDYWDFVDWEYFPDKQEYYAQLHQENFYFFSTKAKEFYDKIPFQKNDFLIFGSETRGLAETWLQAHQERCYRIPIFEKKVRSYNLSSAVAIVAFEAIRQLQS